MINTSLKARITCVTIQAICVTYALKMRKILRFYFNCVAVKTTMGLFSVVFSVENRTLSNTFITCRINPPIICFKSLDLSYTLLQITFSEIIIFLSTPFKTLLLREECTNSIMLHGQGLVTFKNTSGMAVNGFPN